MAQLGGRLRPVTDKPALCAAETAEIPSKVHTMPTRSEVVESMVGDTWICFNNHEFPISGRLRTNTTNIFRRCYFADDYLRLLSYA